MKVFRITFALVGLLSAVTILGVSLASSVPSVYSASDKFKTNDKQFYLEGDILPDHIFYPAVMVADKIKLETASPSERVYINTTYANLRLEATLKLLEKDNSPLALTTLTKSQKYLLQAAHEVLENESSENARTHVLKTIKFHINKHQQIKDGFSDEEKSVIDKLDMECEVFVGLLEESLSDIL